MINATATARLCATCLQGNPLSWPICSTALSQKPKENLRGQQRKGQTSPQSSYLLFLPFESHDLFWFNSPSNAGGASRAAGTRPTQRRVLTDIVEWTSTSPYRGQHREFRSSAEESKARASQAARCTPTGHLQPLTAPTEARAAAGTSHQVPRVPLLLLALILKAPCHLGQATSPLPRLCHL